VQSSRPSDTGNLQIGIERLAMIDAELFSFGFEIRMLAVFISSSLPEIEKDHNSYEYGVLFRVEYLPCFGQQPVQAKPTKVGYTGCG